jgi:hypothetical protein
VWCAADLNVSFANIPHRRWLYGTYLIRGEITVLAAPGGAGKTALATGIAVEIAAGVTKLGETLWKSADQKVLYINGEDSSTEIARRLWEFCLEHKISEQDIARLSVAAADDPRIQSMSFLRVNERATVLSEDGFNCLQAALETLRPDLVVLDPLVVFCGGGNMNDNAVTIDGEMAPYSPNSTGKNNQRAILDNAMAAVERATPDREWLSRDLRATVERELEALKQEGWVVVEEIKTGRFRRSYGLRPVWERTPWAKERENLQQHGGPTVRTAQEIGQLEESDRRDLDQLPMAVVVVNAPIIGALTTCHPHPCYSPCPDRSGAAPHCAASATAAS